MMVNDVLLIKVNTDKGICTNLTNFVFFCICLVPFKKSKRICCDLLSENYSLSIFGLFGCCQKLLLGRKNETSSLKSIVLLPDCISHRSKLKPKSC